MTPGLGASAIKSQLGVPSSPQQQSVTGLQKSTLGDSECETSSEETPKVVDDTHEGH